MLFRSILAAVALLVSTAASAAPITYQINGLPGQGSAYGLTGYITTDGTIGNLTESNILSWSWNLTKNGSNYSDSSAIADARVSVWGVLTATAESISLVDTAQFEQLELYRLTRGLYQSKIGFYLNYGYLQFDYRGLSVPSEGWVQVGIRDQDGVYNIATVAQSVGVSVPEPNSASLVLLAAIAVLGVRQAKQKRIAEVCDLEG